MSRINIIVAVADNGAIGFENRLLYYLPNDLTHFKNLTTGHTIIMGRRTFESLPKGALPNRRNIVLSRKPLIFPGAETFYSLEKALEDCSNEKDVYIIGGATIYKEALPIADRLCVTHIFATPVKADVFFPTISLEDWKEVSREHHEADDRHIYPYDFVDYERK